MRWFRTRPPWAKRMFSGCQPPQTLRPRSRSAKEEPAYDQGMEVIHSIGDHLVIGGGWHHFNPSGSSYTTYYEKPAIWVLEK